MSKLVGKYGNMVRVNVWLTSAQYRVIERYCEITEKSKNEAIREAVQLGVNSWVNGGVVK